MSASVGSGLAVAYGDLVVEIDGERRRVLRVSFVRDGQIETWPETAEQRVWDRQRSLYSQKTGKKVGLTRDERARLGDRVPYIVQATDEEIAAAKAYEEREKKAIALRARFREWRTWTEVPFDVLERVAAILEGEVTR